MRLALDLATNLGWAYGDGVDRPVCGSHRLPSAGTDYGLFGTAYQDWLRGFLERRPVDSVIYESPILPGTTQIATIRKLYSLGTVTEMVCRDLQIRCREASMQTVRSYFIGTSRAPAALDQRQRRGWIKSRIIEECRRRGWDPHGDDEADALSILAWSHWYDAQRNREPSFNL